MKPFKEGKPSLGRFKTHRLGSADYTGFIVFFDFSAGGVRGSGRALSTPSGPPWGIKGVLLLYLKTNTPLLHAEDLTRPRPQGPGEYTFIHAFEIRIFKHSDFDKMHFKLQTSAFNI